LVSTKRTADPNDSDFVGDDILEKMLVSAKSGACSAGSVPSTQSPKHANKENSKKSTTAPAKKKNVHLPLLNLNLQMLNQKDQSL
jgi:hypothetical protein